MFRLIGSTRSYPSWANPGSRYRKLNELDCLLDGTFYDHLPYAFYEEIDQAGKLIPLIKRRPSSKYGLAAMVARTTSRKMFAERYYPRFRVEDKKAQLRLNSYLRGIKFNNNMLEAAYLGSVGSVAITFRCDGTRPYLSVWRAKHCQPRFDVNGDLVSLRVAYASYGAQFMSLNNCPADVEPDRVYWYIRDFTAQADVLYKPELLDDWNPVVGFTKKNRDGTVKVLQPWEEESTYHQYGFVPGHWFRNLVGGNAPDGACTWEPAIANSIELDYTLSQIGRGSRYSAAPQLVVVGDATTSGAGGPDETTTRGPAHVLHLEAETKDEDGTTTGRGDAKLLEMTGAGTEAALKLINELRNLALEQISATRKDPERVRGPMSGRAMEFMDEEWYDLIQDLRLSYGESGSLLLVRKLLMACPVDGVSPEAVTIMWPRIYQPTPADLAALIPALAQAINPLEVVYNGGEAKPGRAKSGEGAKSAPKAPAATTAGKPTPPPPEFMLLTAEQARAYLALNMDLSLLDIDAETLPEDVLEDVEEKPVETHHEPQDRRPTPVDPAV